MLWKICRSRWLTYRSAPLLRDDRLSSTAWSLFGQVPKGWPPGPGHLRLCAQAHCLRLPPRQPNQDRRGTPIPSATACAGDFAHLAVTLCRWHERSGALLHRLSRDIGVRSTPVRWIQCCSRAYSAALVHVDAAITRRASAAS